MKADLTAWSTRFRSPLVAALVLLLAFDLAFVWQRQIGAYTSEFGAHPDEPAHFVTGLMMRDYIASGFPAPPMKFAEDYYRHYPKIGLGVWPPFFYVVQSGWMLPFGAGRTSVLMLMAALAALLGWTFFRAVRDEFGTGLAALAAAFLLSLPLVREHYSMVMAETLVALLMFGAMLKLGRFLDEERPRDALWFGLLAALAILTKGTAMALALAAPLALIFTRRWRLLCEPSLWGSAALVAVIAGPWTWHFRNEGHLKGGWLQAQPSWDYTREAVAYYGGKFGISLGLAFLLLFVIGFLGKLLRPGARHGVWSAAGALVIAVLIFQSIVPAGLEARHLIPALPAAMMFAVAGFDSIWRRFTARAGEPQTGSGTLQFAAFISAGLLSLLVPSYFTDGLPSKHWSGFAAAAEAILAQDSRTAQKVLISSDARGEGMFISELALRDQRPGREIQRASKVLAKSAWSGRGYEPRFSEEDEMIAFFENGEIDYVVVDDSLPSDKRGKHHDMLWRSTEDHGGLFWLVATVPVTRGGSSDFPPIKVYRVRRRN